ncbi:aminotransferase class I/II-fold pyridoxal phosphate-dependent enzyme [Fibrisoma montanum]|uniref:Aminotransferase class I/II-fold pyridoxal phosphate-dependent enzyme n=1 Tax=Fibrisoma montanum TaxID=2305895 RepID=A0A418M8T3_9BACT|nr:histidinol-phosphate transaminase [Fibrisoma montanum]RIV22505.1 aminotransferase class I/II-fold pyridoxal phosphate-dependent enzyme [Fibrisoma montanum]
MSTYTRRDWLRASGLLTAGLSTGLKFTKAAAPTGFVQSTFVNEFASMPPDLPKLRARLFANENPHGIAPSAREALVKAADLGNRYAWMEFAQLKQAIAENEGVKPSNIMMSPGSSDLLMAAAAHYAKGGGTILTSAMTYDDLLERAEAFGAKIVSVPMTKNYQYDLATIKSKLTPDVKMVYIVNPNNPTGTIVPPAELEAFCREVAPKVPIFMDEAYIDFLEPADRPKLGKLVADGQNVILTRTFSKIHGFAGLRLGYAIGQPDTLKALRQYTNGEFAVSITTLMAGIASYKDVDWQNHCRTENHKARAYTTKALADLGYEVIPSYANFILFPIRMKTKTFENQMFSQGIGIQTREFGGQPFCRVSVGTMDEMLAFVETFKKVVG